MGGLKRYLEHKVPLLRWFGCNSHKVALCFKHFIPQFPCIVKLICCFLNLWQHRDLATSFFWKTQQTYTAMILLYQCVQV